MPNPAAQATLATANDAISVFNLGGGQQNDVQVAFELVSNTGVTAVVIFEYQRTSTSGWTSAAAFDLKALGASQSGNITLTDSTNYSFIMPYVAGYYGKRCRLVSISSGTLTADAVGLGIGEAEAFPLPLAITQASLATAIASSSAQAFAVGLNGATNPAFDVDASTGSQAAGLKITGAATGGTVAVVCIDSGAATSLTINAKGTGTIGIGSVSTGAVTITPAATITGALSCSSTVNITSASATSLAVGLTGATNSAFVVDSSTGSQVAGLKVTGAATGGTVAIVCIDSGGATNLTINAKGTGTIGIGSVSTGAVTITPATTITGILTSSGGITMADAKNIIVNATTGTQIATATTQKLGLWAATPVVQPVANTDTTTGAAGSTTAVFLNTTFTGPSGASAYTIGGIIKALKAVGILAA